MVACLQINEVLYMLIQVKRLIAGVTMLAAGGAGHIYPTTTNPLVSENISLGKFSVDISASFWHVKNSSLCYAGSNR